MLYAKGIFIGVLATVTMDLLSTIVYKLRLIAPLPRGLIGRWFASVARGQMFVGDIAQLAPANREVTIALCVHYVIGITLALAYLLLSSTLGLSPRNLLLALGFALCTNAFPWFLMFPAMGYGWFGSGGPAGTRLFLSSLVSHCFYGVGLWLGASILS
jgi:hypothetical protein